MTKTAELQKVNSAGAELLARANFFGAHFVGNGFNHETVAEDGTFNSEGAWVYDAFTFVINQSAVEKMISAGYLSVNLLDRQVPRLVVTKAGEDALDAAIPNIVLPTGAKVNSVEHFYAMIVNRNDPDFRSVMYEAGENVFS